MSLPIQERTLRWLRPGLGLALVLHAFGHAEAVVNASIRIGAEHALSSAQRAHSILWLASVLAALAVTALLAGGLGALGVRAFARRWPFFASTGLLASFALLVLFKPADMLVGVLLGACLFVTTRHVGWAHPQKAQPAPARSQHDWLHVVALVSWLLLLTGTASSLLLRPVFLRWGSRPHESYFELPGDQLPAGKGFQILHAININATPEQVWPWLAQVGHDRGGFYSYSWLENLFGLDIVNANRIVPEWQIRSIGELVPATPRNWLGLIDEPMGWRVTRFEPGRVLFLENWGAFALVKIDPAHTRFYIRSQGAANDDASLWWSPLELLVFEPIHFVMQRKMMLTIKRLAEESARHERTALTQ